MDVYFYKRVYGRKSTNQLKYKWRDKNSITKQPSKTFNKYYMVFIDNITTKRPKRNELEHMLNMVREGDVVEVETLYDLSWSLKDLKTTIDALTSKGVSILFINDNLSINLKTDMGKKNYNLLLMFSSFQKECDKKRHKEGIEIGKAKGNYKGRPPKPLPKKFEYWVKKWEEDKTISCKYIQKQLGMSPTTFYRRYNQWKEEQNKKSAE